jgi:hypothetical protein
MCIGDALPYNGVVKMGPQRAIGKYLDAYVSSHKSDTDVWEIFAGRPI